MIGPLEDYTAYYSNCSLDELHGIARQLDKEKYPERYHVLTKQIALKEEAARRTPIDSARIATAQKIVRIVAAVQIFLGIFSVVPLLALLGVIPSAADTLQLIIGAIPSAGLLSGVLLWKGQHLGVTLSEILLLIQIPTWGSSTFNGHIAYHIGFNGIPLIALLVLAHYYQISIPEGDTG